MPSHRALNRRLHSSLNRRLHSALNRRLHSALNRRLHKALNRPPLAASRPRDTLSQPPRATHTRYAHHPSPTTSRSLTPARHPPPTTARLPYTICASPFANHLSQPQPHVLLGAIRPSTLFTQRNPTWCLQKLKLILSISISLLYFTAKIAENLSQDQEDAALSGVPSKTYAEPNDALGKVFGPEHPGCVRGLGVGVCPSKVFGLQGQVVGSVRTSNSSDNNQTHVRIEDLVKQVNNLQDNLVGYQETKLELSQTQAKLTTLHKFLQDKFGSDVPNLEDISHL